MVITKATLCKTVHDMDGVLMAPTTPEIAKLLRGIVSNSYMESNDYKLRTACGAFLQGYSDDEHYPWVMIEFWMKTGHQEFINHLNAEIAKL